MENGKTLRQVVITKITEVSAHSGRPEETNIDISHLIISKQPDTVVFSAKPDTSKKTWYKHPSSQRISTRQAPITVQQRHPEQYLKPFQDVTTEALRYRLQQLYIQRQRGMSRERFQKERKRIQNELDRRETQEVNLQTTGGESND